MRTTNCGAVLVFICMNVEPHRDDQPPDFGPSELDAAELVHWEQLVQNVKGLSPTLKTAWYDLRLMPGAPSVWRFGFRFRG